MGRFVEISIEPTALSAEQAASVVSACPVDIFALDLGGAITTVPENEDECILCARCVELAPAATSVRRTYGSRRPLSATVEGPDD